MSKTKEMKHTRWTLTLATVLLCFAGAALLSKELWVCADGKTFVKEWTGNVGGVLGNVTVTDTTGKLWFNGPIPETKKMVFMIEWKDWRGTNQERWVVECTQDGTSYLVNDIPYPKSAQPT
jgi:hypothetical protein